MNNRRSFIVGIKSTKLSDKEEHFLKKYKPWGVILFSRNIKDIKQTFKLTSSIRKVFKDKRYPILSRNKAWYKFLDRKENATIFLDSDILINECFDELLGTEFDIAFT